MDASFIIYTGIPTPNIPITPGQNLQLILQNIDNAFNSISPAPDYSGFNLACLRDYYTIDTTQQFAEGISDFVCTLRSDYNAFTGTTYPSDQSVITTAITNLQVPALTYVPFSIVNTDNITVVWSKVFSGFDGILAALNPSSADWGLLSITPPTDVTTGFNDLITYLNTLTTTVNGKQDQIGSFNNTGNCLDGGDEDSIYSTVGQLITYVCNMYTYSPGDITWVCVTPQSNMQDTIQALVNSISSVTTNYVAGHGVGLTQSSLGACSGTGLSVDATWEGLHKVGISSGDASYDFLENKITSLDGSIVIDTSSDPTKMDLSVASPSDYTVKASSIDTTPSYLINKIPSNTDPVWGLSINSTLSVDGTQVNLTPGIIPSLFIQQLFSYISTDPDLLAQFCTLQTQCAGCLCATITDLVVSLGEGTFVLTWTPTGGSTTSQIAKYRQRDGSAWITSNFSPANVLGAMADTTQAIGLLFNTVYQFQVDSVCPGAISNSNIQENIIYTCQGLTSVVNAGVISVNQSPLSTISTIQYQLINSGAVVVDTQIATGINPQATFASQAPDTYSVAWRYGTLINGIMIYSDDASQLNSYCSQGGIVIS